MTFIVADLDAMEQVLVSVLGARKVYDSGSRTFSLSEERFYLLGEQALWIAVMLGEALPARSYNHVAFKIDAAELETYRERIAALGLEFRESRPRVSGEGSSLYFYDHDNHLFELHTGTLSERLARYEASQPVDAASMETKP